ncbi:MutS protein msh4 [Agyrium rufum]|nr:MutS protein msh4 [Agyrium rufum]
MKSSNKRTYSRSTTGEVSTTTQAFSTSAESGRPGTRPKSSASTSHGQQIVCAITESRGISPTVGLAFINLTTAEIVICQIIDNPTYVKTLHKLSVFEPSEILIANTALHPSKSKLYSIIESDLPELCILSIDRKYWAEATGIDYIHQLAFKEDIEAIKVAIGGNYYATCCLAAALKHVELNYLTFTPNSIRIKYQPSEGSMLIDLSTIRSLELVQNLQLARSKDCLFGLLNETSTPMGARLLRANILQPSTSETTLSKRYDAVEELTAKEDIFGVIRNALKSFLDVDKALTNIIIIPTKRSIFLAEQSINHVIVLKQYIDSVGPVFEALGGAKCELLRSIQSLCAPPRIAAVKGLIENTINADTKYTSKPLGLRYQRTYAAKAGVNGMLDVARQTYDEANTDAANHVNALKEEFGLDLLLKYDNSRQYYIQLPATDVAENPLPDIFINVYKRKTNLEFQTLDLVKYNQKIMDSHHEVLQLSDNMIQDLIEDIREHAATLFKVSEAIATLDVIASLASVAAAQDYCRPELTDTLCITNARHPVCEKIHRNKFIPNDVYTTQQTRFQIITGCNMSGKSTYIRSIALMQIMAQIGSFIPATYASFSIRHQLFARVSTDDSIEANISTFAAEMHEMAFILNNVDNRSMVIIDELGRGTSTRDGLCIAIAIAENLVNSHAFMYFVTHFRDLARILNERPGVINRHLSVDIDAASSDMKMLYKIKEGWVKQDNYGLALAKVSGVPPFVLDVAQEVSEVLNQQNERRKRTSPSVLRARSKKLVFGLREHLIQLSDGNMEGEVLNSYLHKLQDEFVTRMSAMEKEIEEAERLRYRDHDDRQSQGNDKDEEEHDQDEQSESETENVDQSSLVESTVPRMDRHRSLQALRHGSEPVSITLSSPTTSILNDVYGGRQA